MAPTRKPERAADRRPPAAAEPVVTPEPAPDLIRAGVPLSLDGESVLWDRFKNDTGRTRTRKFIRNEAIKMGMVEKPTDGSATGAASDEIVTVDDVCGFVSLLLQAAAVQTIPNLDADDLALVTIQPHHVAMMNKGGAGDRVLAKWIGRMPVKDEVTFGAGVLMAGASIFGSFRQLRATKLAAVEAAARRATGPQRVERQENDRERVMAMGVPGMADATVGS